MNRRRGFTMTELLVVILIISALMAVMSANSTEGLSSAKVGNIVYNLKTLKQAAVAVYLRSRDQWEEKGVQPVAKDVFEYMMDDADYSGYELYLTDFTDSKTASECQWYVCYVFPEYAFETDSIKDKLAGRAKNVGLRSIKVDVDGVFTGVGDIYTKEYRAVGLRVR